MAVAAFAARLREAFDEAGLDGQKCEFDEASGQMILHGDVTRVVPVGMLFAHFAACKDEEARNKLVTAVLEAFVDGRADAPHELRSCGDRLLPQLWPLSKISARQLTLPTGFDLPHCGLHGEAPPLKAELGVVLVCEYCADGLPPIETPLLSSDLLRWGVTFEAALKTALQNLRERTKKGKDASSRWEHHPTGCGESCWKDRFDAVRVAVFPKLVATRKRPDGVEEQGGHVISFATHSCVLASTSKNALGLCFMGDTLHLQLKAKEPKQLLSITPMRLMKMKDRPRDGERHPLQAPASEGMVWQWLPYSPGGPPLHSPGEFSVPIDQGEVDAILAAAENGQPVPVFTKDASKSKAATSEAFLRKKEEGNALFKAGDYLKAIRAYDAALAEPCGDGDASIAQSNAAQALLNLAGEASGEAGRAAAAEALRRAREAISKDSTNAKAFARCAAACDILGEAEAAAEFRGHASRCEAAAQATRNQRKAEEEQRQEAKRQQREKLAAAQEAERRREELLERERREEALRQAAEDDGKADATAGRLSSMLGLDANLASLGSA